MVDEIKMLFKFKIRETPLTQAVLSEDTQTLEQLGKYRDQVLAENGLQFNALELAEYLGKRECLKYLHPDKKSFENFFGIKYASRFQFSDYSSFQEVLRYCSWVFKTELFAEDPLDLGKKYREGIIGGTFAPVKIQWINDRLGHGVFADEDFEAGRCIGEYTGYVHRVWQSNDYCLMYPKMFWQWGRFVIDAKDIGNESRFLNHSTRPNLAVKMAVDRNLVHPLFFTNQSIPKGTQLTFDYGKDYWKRRGEPDLIV
jgi:hypothetical protein